MKKKLRWYVSPLFIIMAAALITLGYFYELLIYFATIVLHELAHAEVSLKLGYTLDRFVLMPYGASLSGDFEGVRSDDEILIALAGPLYNASIAVICTALWWLAPATYAFTDKLVAANIFTAVFNLLPVFPLDGGRVVLALLGKKMPRQKAYKRLRIVGFVVSPLFAALFILTATVMGAINFSFALMSAFILMSTVFPDKNSTYRRLYGMAYFSERLKRGLKVSQIAVPDTMTLIELDRMLNANYYTQFVVVNGEYKERQRISEIELDELLKTHSPNTRLCDITKSPLL